jgi:hypothetical protein
MYKADKRDSIKNENNICVSLQNSGVLMGVFMRSFIVLIPMHSFFELREVVFALATSSLRPLSWCKKNILV